MAFAAAANAQPTLAKRRCTLCKTLSGMRIVLYDLLNRVSSPPHSTTPGSPINILRIVFSLKPHSLAISVTE